MRIYLSYYDAVIRCLGIWPEGADGTDVNTCSRSHRQHLVASGNDFGKVTLFSYPCFQPKVSERLMNGCCSIAQVSKQHICILVQFVAWWRIVWGMEHSSSIRHHINPSAVPNLSTGISTQIPPIIVFDIVHLRPDFLHTLQSHYNMVVYNTNSVITRLRLGSHCLPLSCTRLIITLFFYSTDILWTPKSVL